MSDEKKPFFISARGRAALPEERQKHPLNPNSEIAGWSLSDLVGLKRCGLYLLKIAPGKESFAYHSHRVQEEFFYALSGRAIAEVDGKEYEVGPGDFMGFPTPSVAHHLRNPFAEEFVYLCGGEKGRAEVADFPRLGKRLIFAGGEAMLADIDAFTTPKWGG